MKEQSLGGSASEETLAGLVSWVEQTDDVVGVCDAWGRLLYLNPAACKLLGVGNVEGLTIADVFPTESFGLFFDVARPELARRGTWSGDVVAKAGASGFVRLHVSATMDVDPDGASRRFVLIGRVVASHDAYPVDIGGHPESLGALAAESFQERVASVLDTAQDGGPCAVVVYDFSEVVAAAGAHGDDIVEQVMRSMALRLRRATFTTDSVGALSEHQFAVLLRGIDRRQDAVRIAKTIGNDLSDPPVETTIGPMPVAARYGVAFSRGNDDPAAFVRAAVPPQDDVGTTTGAQSPEGAHEQIAVGLPEIAELQPAFSVGEVKAYAQAVIDPSSRALLGYRGFAQWHHRERGLLGPSIVEQVAGNSALAPVIDLYVARETATLLVVASRERPLVLHTTASTRLLLDIYTEQRLDEIATAYFLAMHQIHLFIDATILGRADTRLRDALRGLADADLSLVLANVSHPDVDVEDVVQLGFRAIDLSPRLVAKSAVDPVSRGVAIDLAEKAHNADLLVLANGVSTEQQHDTIVQIGSDLATGDLYGPKQLTEALIDQ